MTDLEISAIIPAREADLPAARRVAESLRGSVDEVIIQGGPGGCGHAKNVGASHAFGRILVFTDSDAHLEGDFHGLLEKRHAREDFWIANWYTTKAQTIYTQAGIVWTNMLCRLGYPWTISPCMAVRKIAFDHIGGHDLNAPWEDLSVGFQLLRRGYRMGRAPVNCDVVRPFTVAFSRYTVNKPLNGPGKIPNEDMPYERLIF